METFGEEQRVGREIREGIEWRKEPGYQVSEEFLSFLLSSFTGGRLSQLAYCVARCQCVDRPMVYLKTKEL